MRLFLGPSEIHNTQRLLELLERRRHLARARSSPVSSIKHRTLKLSLKVQNPNDFTHGTYVTYWGAADGTVVGRAAERLLAIIGQGIGQVSHG